MEKNLEDYIATE